MIELYFLSLYMKGLFFVEPFHLGISKISFFLNLWWKTFKFLSSSWVPIWKVENLIGEESIVEKVLEFGEVVRVVQYHNEMGLISLKKLEIGINIVEMLLVGIWEVQETSFVLI